MLLRCLIDFIHSNRRAFLKSLLAFLPVTFLRLAGVWLVWSYAVMEFREEGKERQADAEAPEDIAGES